MNNIFYPVALFLSGVAEFFGITGLVALFPAAPLSVIVMGIALALAKIATVIWLAKYWSDSRVLHRLYLLFAVMVLMFINTASCFGYLSKAHTDSALAPAAKVSQLEHIDTKIATHLEEIASLKSELAMLDKQVNSYLDRGVEVNTVTKSVQLRRNQAADRKRIQKDLDAAQTAISTLREQRVPIDMELKKLEAEVGPIKYVAAVIYGDNPDSNLLDRAVRWMTILLVVVFDPLAVALVIAANYSKELETKLRAKREEQEIEPEILRLADPVQMPVSEPVVFEPPEEVTPPAVASDATVAKKQRKPKKPKATKQAEQPKGAKTREHTNFPIPLKGMTREVIRPTDDYLIFQGKKTHVRVVRETSPKLFMTPEEEKIPMLRYGVEFPKIAASGERFTRIDLSPHCLFMFVAGEWVLVSELDSDHYINDPQYLSQVRALIAAGYATAEFFGQETADRIAISDGKA